MVVLVRMEEESQLLVLLLEPQLRYGSDGKTEGQEGIAGVPENVLGSHSLPQNKSLCAMSVPQDSKQFADIVLFNERDFATLQVSLVSAGITIVHSGRFHARVCTFTKERWDWLRQFYDPHANTMVKAFDVITVPTH